jgi:hypothetical protein
LDYFIGGLANSGTVYKEFIPLLATTDLPIDCPIFEVKPFELDQVTPLDQSTLTLIYDGLGLLATETHVSTTTPIILDYYLKVTSEGYLYNTPHFIKSRVIVCGDEIFELKPTLGYVYPWYQILLQ